jgi:CubicO group peptidase (beta-lactamase class C family)
MRAAPPRATVAIAAAAAAASFAAPGSAVAITPDNGSSVDSGQMTGSISDAARVLGQQLNFSGIPGGAVVIVSDGGVEARGSGTDGAGHEVTADTPFVLGSATKSFTALAVMQLVDAGTVSLDEPVRSYVPELKLAAGEPVDDITVRQVLQQTSGLDDLTGGPLVASATDGTATEAIAELKNAKLASAPGKTWRYANVNYVLAGLIVEHASGQPYGQYVEDHIFEPLGMAHSYVTAEAARSAGLSQGHRFWFGFPVATGPTAREATRAAGYLISTAEDIGRYLAMYLAGGVAQDGTRVVSSASVETLTSPGPTAELGPWAQGQESRYAMGWFRGGPWGDDVAFHPGNTPDTSTMLTMFPERGVAVATLLNAGNELPVPGNPFIADRVGRNVIHAALGQPVVDLPSIRTFYMVFDLVVLSLLAAAGWALLRAVRALRSSRSPDHRVRRWLGVLVRSLAVVALVALPLLSAGWRAAWTWAPDLTLVIAALAVLLATTTAFRVLSLTRRRQPDSMHDVITEVGGQHVHA